MDRLKVLEIMEQRLIAISGSVEALRIAICELMLDELSKKEIKEN